jgi:hypothetical protein
VNPILYALRHIDVPGRYDLTFGPVHPPIGPRPGHQVIAENEKSKRTKKERNEARTEGEV